MAFVKNMSNNNSLAMGSEFHGNLTISNILGEVSMVDDVSEKLKRLEFHVHRMKAEMLKIDGLKHELPFCIKLLKDGIEMLNREILKWKGKGVKPVMEEFTSLKSDGIGRTNMLNDTNGESNWLSSAQLWTVSVEYEGHQFGDARNPKSFDPLKSHHQGDKSDGHESQLLKMPNSLVNKGGVFMPYNREHGALLPPLIAAEVDVKKPNVEEPHQKRSDKKQMRRCWSPQLHMRFVDALHQLGGAKMATPKQIRELMQVEGLTNDEVKSHLQKYRIHLRKRDSSVPRDLSWLPHDDPSLELTMAIVSPQGDSTANGTSSSKGKSNGESMVVRDANFVAFLQAEGNT